VDAPASSTPASISVSTVGAGNVAFTSSAIEKSSAAGSLVVKTAR